MTGFYNITTAIKNQLLQDVFCNSVTIGDIFEVDLSKQTIFPLSHIIVNNAALENNIWRFNMTVIAMDIVDKTKDLTTDKFRGNDNEHDVLNTQLAVLNRLFEILRRGSLYEEHYQLDGNPTLEPFTERFENYLAGWAGTFDVLIPNDMTACDGFETPTVLCENGVVTIRDAAGNVLHTVSVASGGTASQTISDSTAVLQNTADTILSTTSINAEASADIVAPDAHVHLKKEDDGTIDNLLVPSGVTQNYVIQNNDISVNGVFEFDIHATDPLDIRLRDTSNGVVPPVSVTDSGSHATIVIPDTTIEVNGVSEGSVVAGSTVDVQLSDSGGTVTPTSITQVGNDFQIVLPDAPSAVTRSTATLIKTGQTTSYRTGDDGDIEAGRDVDFFTLAANNPFGNTNRFTDELGGQTYTNDIVIDWSTYNGSTVLGYRRTQNGININWNDSIDNCLALSIGTFTSGWRLPNLKEINNIVNLETTNGLGFDYTPFNLPNLNLWTSTSLKASTTQAWRYVTYGATGYIAKTSTVGMRYIPVRNFTVTGTTLS